MTPEPRADGATPGRYRSKTIASWLALVGGGLGLHRFYLHGPRDLWGWLMPLPTLLGLAGVQRMRAFGQDDQVAWLLIPLLGLSLSAAMLTAIVYGLMPDERWNARHNPAGRAHRTGWLTIVGVVLALLLGGGILMATIAFSGQHYFEYMLERDASAGR